MALMWHQCGKWMMWHHVAYDEVVGVGVQGVGLGKGARVQDSIGVQRCECPLW